MYIYHHILVKSLWSVSPFKQSNQADEVHDIYQSVKVLTGRVRDSGERLLTFELNSQSDCTPHFRAPKATCWLAGIVYGLFWATMFVIRLQHQACTKHCFFLAHTLDDRWIWQIVYWIRIADSTFNDGDSLSLSLTHFQNKHLHYMYWRKVFDWW